MHSSVTIIKVFKDPTRWFHKQEKDKTVLLQKPTVFLRKMPSTAILVIRPYK